MPTSNQMARGWGVLPDFGRVKIALGAELQAGSGLTEQDLEWGHKGERIQFKFDAVPPHGGRKGGESRGVHRRQGPAAPWRNWWQSSAGRRSRR